MRALILADRSLAHREHALLRRLEIGLIDEGVRVIRAMPDSAPFVDATGLAGSVLYPIARWRIGRFSPAGLLFRKLRELSGTMPDPKDAKTIDVIHAWGHHCWPMAVQLARACNACLVLDVWSADAARLIPTIERHARELESEGIRGLWSAPDEAAGAIARGYARQWPVHVVPWGVHVRSDDVPVRAADQPRSICLLSGGRDPAGTDVALEAIGRCAVDEPSLLVFVDAAAIEHHLELWKKARRLPLEDPPSVIAQMERQRDIVLRADVLVYPEARAEHRSIILEAMARGMILVAAFDERVSDIIDGVTALAVKGRDPAVWSEALRKALFDEDIASRLRASAREHVRRIHPMSEQVRATITAYESLAEAQTLSFQRAD